MIGLCRNMMARWKRQLHRPPSATNIAETERLAYSIQESADLLGVDYFSVYRRWESTCALFLAIPRAFLPLVSASIKSAPKWEPP